MALSSSTRSENSLGNKELFVFMTNDNHILEVAEKMDEVSYRLFKEEKTIEEISKLTGIPVEEVLQHINKYD
jgi:hypothetical protein